jgi:type II secretory pathway pseudopilin PulG
VAIAAAIAVRRIIANVREIRELSRELSGMRARIAALREEMRRRD